MHAHQLPVLFEFATWAFPVPRQRSNVVSYVKRSSRIRPWYQPLNLMITDVHELVF